MINVYEIDESVSVYDNSKLQVLYTVGFKMIKNFDTQVYEIQLALILNCVLPICFKGMFGKFWRKSTKDCYNYRADGYIL